MKHGPAWYWHRLRAMGRAEIRARLAQKLRQRADGRRPPNFAASVPPAIPPSAWPVLPARDAVPREFADALAGDLADLRAGRWRAFGHLLLQIDDPPKWFTDYAARRDLHASRPGFRLNHRQLPEGCDIKLIWELSRWQPLVRLAQAAWVLDDPTAARKCLAWLDDWRRRNPPYRGWNWTSALEVGLRLINLAWIDALLSAAGAGTDALQALRGQLVPAHLWYAWRHRSFGSSANNHLLGELAGLIAGAVRWPDLEKWGAPLADLRREFQREVLAQFAPDGGNREQALNYQLFAWELAWHARSALAAAGLPVDPEVEERLQRAADFFVTVQVPTDPWDYGDSDSAIVTPLPADLSRAAGEWYDWLADPAGSPALRWWLGDPPPPRQPPACVPGAGDWLVYPDSGQGVCWTGNWQVRWDLSPLGYLSTAAHGHLDALHCSLWLKSVALAIDPGTGAYYGDTRLRAWLASWPAHNGPIPVGTNHPRRLGPFLWESHHDRPTWKVLDPETMAAELALPAGTARRHLRRLADATRDGWQVDDLFLPSGSDGSPAFEVCWQFAPGTRLEPAPGNPRFFHGERRGVRFTVGLDAAWSEVTLIPETTTSVGFPVRGDLVGLCSSAFRRIEAGPRLRLSARGGNPAMYRTTFLAVRDEAGDARYRPASA